MDAIFGVFVPQMASSNNLISTEKHYVTIKTAKWSALPAFQPHPLAFVSELLS